jgi:hypothetical protein
MELLVLEPCALLLARGARAHAESEYLPRDFSRVQRLRLGGERQAQTFIANNEA